MCLRVHLTHSRLREQEGHQICRGVEDLWLTRTHQILILSLIHWKERNIVKAEGNWVSDAAVSREANQTGEFEANIAFCRGPYRHLDLRRNKYNCQETTVPCSSHLLLSIEAKDIQLSDLHWIASNENNHAARYYSNIKPIIFPFLAVATTYLHPTQRDTKTKMKETKKRAKNKRKFGKSNEIRPHTCHTISIVWHKCR